MSASDEDSEAEVQHALDILRWHGWEIRVDAGYGILTELAMGENHVVRLLQHTLAPHPAAKDYLRSCAQEPWKEKT